MVMLPPMGPQRRSNAAMTRRRFIRRMSGLLLAASARPAANPSWPARRGSTHGSDGPPDACRMVVQGRDSLQHVPKLQFMK